MSRTSAVRARTLQRQEEEPLLHDYDIWWEGLETFWNVITGGKWTCTASCNIAGGNKPECTGRVTGSASGPSQEQACREAKRDATQKAPPGCYARHCQCDCSKR
jgi:hypothetical protein